MGIELTDDNDPLPADITGYHTLTAGSGTLTVHRGEYLKVVGSGGSDTLSLESGARVSCINFSGSTIEISDNASGFKVSRSGATVTLQSDAKGTIVKLPAGLSGQTLIFDGVSYELSIMGNQVWLGAQVVRLEETQIETI